MTISTALSRFKDVIILSGIIDETLWFYKNFILFKIFCYNRINNSDCFCNALILKEIFFALFFRGAKNCSDLIF
jgi:hypothetical protein